MDSKDLIKTVRGLDQTGPGSRGENLEILWKSLAESSHGQFHAAEQSILRWLLRSMNGSSPGAETLRRYPLTWTILSCVFHRIPLFSLAKSLADRKFVAVLQQVLRDISKPTHREAASPGGKRKKSPVIQFDLEDLKDLPGCLATGQAVFSLLRSLLSRLEDEATGSRSRFGAEHIKSLFSSSAADSAMLSSAALTVCNLLLSSDSCEEAIEDPADWIATISSIWDLHLQGPDDTLEVATHLFKPAVSILGKVEAFPENGEKPLSEPFTVRWSSDLQKFMHRNLILPARNAFVQRQDFEAVTRALDITKSQASLASPVLYFLAAGAPAAENERDMRRVNAAWMRQIFQAVQVQIRKLPNRNALMEHVLRQAGDKSITIDVEDLRAVCLDYGLRKGETDWSLMAKATVCNLDVFQSFQGDDSLLHEICQRSVEEIKDGNYQAISDLIAAMQKSFCARRNFPGFLKLWFAQLCQVEQRKSVSNSPWFELGRRTDSPSANIESELSPPLLLEVVDWLEGQEPLSHPQALCLFTESIARGLRTEPFIDMMGARLFVLVSRLQQSKSSALKWRVVSRTISWISMDERRKIWAQVKDELSKLLQKKSIKSAETFEALKCCYSIWDSMSQDEEDISNEPASLVDQFTGRLANEIASADILETSSYLDIEASRDYHEEGVLQQYLACYLFGSSRYFKLYWARKTELPSVVDTALSTQKASTEGLRALWEALLCNDVSLNDNRLSRSLLDRLITALADSASEKKTWPDERGRMWIRMLRSIHHEAMSRQQREQAMTILQKGTAKMKGLAGEVALEGWKLVLDLSTKMMSRPTFYEGLRFSHLVEIADELSSLHLEQSTSGEMLLELIERFFTMASTTIKQMAEIRDERSISYFTESSEFITDCSTEPALENGRSGVVPAFRISLLGALATELGRSSAFLGHADLSQQPQNAKQVLAKCIASVLGEFMANRKLLAKHDTAVDLPLFAALNAASIVGDVLTLSKHKASEIQKLEKKSKDAMTDGDLRGWKIQIFLHTYLANELDNPRPTRFTSLSNLPTKSQDGLLREYAAAIIKDMNTAGRARYLEELIAEFTERGCDTDGQILAIQHVVNQLIDGTDFHGKGEGVDLAAAHSALIFSLPRKSPNTAHTCRVLQALLGRKPQAMSQWNIEITLSTVSSLASSSERKDASTLVPFAWLCELVGVIIKKHRLRLEGHHHLLLTVMQSLLRHLVSRAPAAASDGIQTTQESMAHQYGRLITLICEPTAGAVSRTQHHHSALDSATDVAKRSAGRHMYLVLMQYVKLQLEAGVPRGVRETLEPAMNTIFDITPPEVRKILNDAMDGSGRAILREMFKRYTKFGKWNGV